MQFYIKLSLLIAFAVVSQTTFELAMTVGNYPQLGELKFAETQRVAVIAAERRFGQCTRLTRWIVADVLDMNHFTGRVPRHRND